MEELRKPKTGRSCGTCRDRRIRCDRGAPTCANCGRARLECQGYGLRLSWPRDGGGRRALSAPGSCNASQPNVSHPRFFINMQQGHVAAWNNAVSSGSVHMSAPHPLLNTGSYSLHYINHLDHSRAEMMQQRVLQNQIPKTISLSLVDKDDTSLLHYYMQNAGCFLLNPLGSLAHLLLQIGLTDSSPSSVAVLNGLLAISALHVSGEARAISFKSKAIAMTRASLSPNNPDSVVISNLAASMLLYLYETLHMSSPIAWTVYLCGAKHVLQSSAERSALSQSYEVIFDWIIYHETMFLFSQLYWTRKGSKPFCRKRISTIFRRRSGLGKGIEADVTGCDPNILDTISKIFDTLMGEEGLPPSWQTYLLELEGQLRMRILEPLDSDIVPGTTSWMHAVTMLHCLTTVLWINRSVRGYCGTEATHQNLVTQGVTVLAQMKTCDLPWPLFIIAGETRIDEQRRIILSIIHRTRERSKTEHMNMVGELIETLWNYDDLDPDGLLGYDTKLRSIIQAYPWMPPFV